jgi:type I restriction enzyme S subunit
MRRVQIRKVARLGTGHTPSRSIEAYWDPAECTIPWLTLADVWQLRDGTVSVVNETKEKISPLGLAHSSAVRRPAGTVAFSRTASVGFCCILGTEMATSQDFVTWTCGPRLDPRYLLWVLRGERDDILRRTQGSTHKTIYMPDIEQLSIPLPPIDEQRRIVEVIEAEVRRIDGIIQTNDTMLGLLGERSIALAAEAIAGSNLEARSRTRPADWLPSIPATWGWSPVSAHFHVTLGRMLNAARANAGTLKPYIKNVNVRWDNVDVTNLAEMDFPPDDQPRYRLRAGDLLINEGGAGVGRAAIWEGEIAECYFQKSVLRLRPLRDVNPRWFVECMRVAVAQQVVLVEGNISTIPHLPAELLRTMRFPFPERDTQDRQLAWLEVRRARDRELKQSLERQTALLAEHRRSLIVSALAGRREAA